MENETRPTPTPRRGWSWTLLKSALLVAVSAALCAGALFWIVHLVTPPWFIPKFVFEWILKNVTPYALWTGGIVGAILGLLGVPVVIVNDARRGRLSRVP